MGLEKLRVLHVWDQAGVACVIAKYQILKGYDSEVIKVSGYDKYGINKFYNEYLVTVGPEEFVQRCLERAEYADIVHVHSRIDILLKIRQAFGQSKKIILHYHGNDSIATLSQQYDKCARGTLLHSLFRTAKRRVRRFIRNRTDLKAQRLADAVIVSTSDLVDVVRGSTYLPNPIDIDHFKPDSTYKNKEALTLKTEVTDAECTLDYCKKNSINLEIDVYDRTQNPVLHGKMADFLRQYRIYVDIKFVNGTVLHALSKTGLEALACGLRVLNYELRYCEGLPLENNPEKTVSYLSDIYSKKKKLKYIVTSFLLSMLADCGYLVYILIKPIMK